MQTYITHISNTYFKHIFTIYKHLFEIHIVYIYFKHILYIFQVCTFNIQYLYIERDKKIERIIKIVVFNLNILCIMFYVYVKF